MDRTYSCITYCSNDNCIGGVDRRMDDDEKMKCQLCINNKKCGKKSKYKARLYNNNTKNIIFLCVTCYNLHIVFRNIHSFGERIFDVKEIDKK